MQKNGKRGYVCISVLLVGSLIMVIIGSSLIKTLSMARLTQDFDKLRQQLNIKASLGTVIKSAAYEALEPKLGIEVEFRAELNRQLLDLYPNASVESSPSFEQLTFFPKAINLNAIEEAVVILIEDQRYRFQLKIPLLPVTEYDSVAYSLPVSGGTARTVPSNLETLVNSREAKVYCLANDSVFKSSNGSNDELSFLHRHGVGVSWNLYEYIFSPEYQKQLLDKAGSNVVDLTKNYEEETLPAGITYTFESKGLTIDLAKVESDVLSIIDPLGWGDISINDSGTSDAPLVLSFWSRNAGKQQTIKMLQNNRRPVILYCSNSKIVTQGQQLYGGFFLGKEAQWQGSATIKGHMSFYAVAPPFGNNLQILKDSTNQWKRICASFAPQFCEVSVELL